jgi:hypothetical protein
VEEEGEGGSECWERDLGSKSHFLVEMMG